MTAVAYRNSTKAVDDRYFISPQSASLVNAQHQEVLRSLGFNATRTEDPCAGNGEMAKFFSQIDQFDLNPSNPLIVKRDFFAHTQSYEPGLRYIMNPPYGYNSSCAIKFFNHAAQYCDCMCIIVPSTWGNKYSSKLINRLDRNFILVDQIKLPYKSFYLPDNNNKPHDVPSVAQIWMRTPVLCPLLPTAHKTSAFTARHNTNRCNLSPDFAIRRVGARAGEIVTSGFDQLSEDVWWLIESHINLTHLLDAAYRVDWAKYGNRMGQRNINKLELTDGLLTMLQLHS